MDPSVQVAATVGRLISYVTPREMQIATSQIRFVQRQVGVLREREPSTLARQTFTHVGRSCMEILFLKRLTARNSDGSFRHVTTEGDEIGKEVLARGRGAVALSGHIGSIELLAAYHVENGISLGVVGRVPNYPFFATLLEQIRVSYGVQTLWRDESGVGKKLLKSLLKGHCVAALIDQDTALESDFVPFFGQPAAYPTALIRMAVQAEIPILSSFIVRTDSLKHHIVTREITYDPADPAAITKILEVLNAHLEALILQYPDQWIWWHRRWRREPGVNYLYSRLRSTREYLQWLEQ